MEELYLLTFALIKESLGIAEAPPRDNDLDEVVAFHQLLKIQAKIKQIKLEKFND